MTDEHFEATVEAAKDTAGEVTTAFMLREAMRSKVAAIGGAQTSVSMLRRNAKSDARKAVAGCRAVSG